MSGHATSHLPAERVRQIANTCQMPVAVLTSASGPLVSADAVETDGRTFTLCRYEEDRTEVHRLPNHSARTRARFPAAVLRAALPGGVLDAGHGSVFIDGSLRESAVLTRDDQRAYATVMDSDWVVIAVTTAHTGRRAVAPSLRLVLPGTATAEAV